MAKRIRVSSDGITYYTLPGSSGELAVEMATVDDTIFGQDYKSESASIGMWTVTGNSYFKGVAGYTAAVKVGGTPVSATGAATTLVSGKTYQLNTAAQRIIDYNNAVTVYDGAVDHTADVVSIDYLNGTVTFDSGYTVSGAVTLDYYYVPTAAIAKARTFNLTQNAAEIDTTTYAVAAGNSGWRTFIYGLKTVALELSNVWDTATNFITTLQSRAFVYIDISPDNTAGDATAQVMFRGFFKYLKQNQSGNVGALEEEKLSLSLYVPDGALVERPFGWYWGTAPAINTGVKKALDAWQNGDLLYVEYSPDGTATRTGTAVVTDASLANSYEGQNVFSFTLKGSGTLTSA